MQDLRYLIICILLLLLAIQPCQAVDGLVAKTNGTNFNINDAIHFDIVVSDPKLQNLEFQQNTKDYYTVASTTSSNVQIINGSSTYNRIFGFIIRAKHPGKITIPAATMTRGPNIFTTDPITITVTQQNNQKVSKLTRLQNHRLNRPKPRKVSPDKEVFSRLEVNKSNPYLNEQILVKLKIFHRGNLKGIHVTPFNLDHFISQRDNKAKEYREKVDGFEYLVYELSFIFFPIKVGNSEIVANDIQVDIVTSPKPSNRMDPFMLLNPFMMQKTIRLEPDAITVNTRALPSNAPSGFTGYVGDLVVKNELDKSLINTGDAITVKTKFYGNGNFKTLDLKQQIKASKQYNSFRDKEEYSEEVTKDILYFESSNTLAIVPNKNKGRVAVELEPFYSFNPQTGKYEQHGKENFEVIINGAAKSTTKVNKSKAKIKVAEQGPINEDEILSISQDQILAYKPRKIMDENYLLLALLAINLVGFSIKLGKGVRKLNFKRKPNGKQNLKDLLEELKTADSLLELSRVFKTLASSTKPNSELKQKIDNFINEIDQSNYGFNKAMKDGEESRKLEYFRLNAINLAKELLAKKENLVNA